MQDDATPKLTTKQALFVAAYLGVANGNGTEAAIIAGYGSPAWQASVNLRKPNIAAAIARDREELRQRGLTVKRNRLDRLNARWDEIRQIVAARAADPLHRSFPGGETGLLAIEPQLVKVYDVHAPPPPQSLRDRLGGVSDDDEDNDGEDRESLYTPDEGQARTQIVYVAKIDTALIKEERELAKQAAIEMGEWSEKKNDTPTVNVNITNELKAAVIGYDEFTAEFARLAGVGTARSDGSAESLDRAEADAATGVFPLSPGA